MMHTLKIRPLFRYGLTSVFTVHLILQRPSVRLLDASPAQSQSSAFEDSVRRYSNEARTPIFKEDGGLNPRAITQFSMGSVLGTAGGLLLATFSKTLTLLFGLAVFTVQWLASQGHISLPYSRIQKYVKGIDVRKAMEDNAAFKLSFGATFALAAFGSL